MITKSASARYEGLGKDGKGHVSTQSGALQDRAYGFTTRFEGGQGTNPEELIAAAHASCFTMAASFGLAGAGFKDGTLETTCAVDLTKDGDGFTVSRSALSLKANIPGIKPEDFARIVGEAKTNCPISRLLKCEITLDHKLSG